MSEPSFEARLSGELTPAPRGPVLHALVLVSGLGLVVGAARAVSKLALGYQHPAELRLTERGLEVRHETKLLGRTLSDRLTVVPLGTLASIEREIRFPRLGLYAGLLALAAGTYVGAGLLVDGARVPGTSPSLLGLGLALILGSVLLDFVLAEVIPAATKTCRVVVTPHHGKALCVQGLDPREADRVLERVQAATSGAPQRDDGVAPAPAAEPIPAPEEAARPAADSSAG